MLNINFEELSAISPHYTASGDLTGLYFKTGQQDVTPQKIHSLLQNIATHFVCDLRALRHQSKLRTGHTLLQPLFFSSRLLLVPTKVRTSRITGDCTMGYVNKYAVEKIRSISQTPYHTEIILTGNHRLLSLWTMKTVQQALLHAKLATLAPTKNGQADALAQKVVELLQDFCNLRS